MILLIFFLILFFENAETPKINYYLSNCDYNGLIKELEENNYLQRGYGWYWYVLNLRKGEFEKSEILYKDDVQKKVMKNKKEEIELLEVFYKERNYSKVIDYIRNYLKKEKEYESYKRIGINGWIAVVISSIIEDEKDLLEYFLKKENKGVYYCLSYYYLNHKLPEGIKAEDFGHPDKKAYMLYIENKIKKEELIEKLKECYKDLPVWLEINIDLIKSLP